MDKVAVVFDFHAKHAFDHATVAAAAAAAADSVGAECLAHSLSAPTPMQ